MHLIANTVTHLRDCLSLLKLGILAWAALMTVLPIKAQTFDAEEAESSTYRILSQLRGGGTGLGSGFLINNNGYVVTNYHVVDDSRKVHVTQRHGDIIKVWEALVHSTHPSLDLAILRVEGIIGKPVFFAEQNPKKAEEVYAVGFPGQADEQTERNAFLRALNASRYRDISANPTYNNVVSATVRTGNIEAIRMQPWGNNDEPAMVISHDANITEGNSGGPLFTKNGHFIGVNTQGKVAGTRIGNVIRMSSLYTELETILDKQELPYLKAGRDSPPKTIEKDDDSSDSKKEKKEEPNGDTESGKDSKPDDGASNNLSKYGGYLAILLGVIITALALYLGLRKDKKSSPEPSASTANSPAPVAGQAPPHPSPLQAIQAKESVIIPVVNQPKSRPAPKESSLKCLLISKEPNNSSFQVQFTDGDISKSGFILGRSSSANGRINHASVSRSHAKIKVTENSLYLADAGSSNGTYHNGKRLAHKTGIILKTGDLIKLGEVTLEVKVSKI